MILREILKGAKPADLPVEVRRHKKEIAERVLRRKGIEESRCKEPAELRAALVAIFVPILFFAILIGCVCLVTKGTTATPSSHFIYGQ